MTTDMDGIMLIVGVVIGCLLFVILKPGRAKGQ